MARIPRARRENRNGNGDGKENEQGGETPTPGRTSTPPSVQEMPSQEQPTPERLNDRQRAQFEKIRRSQGKEAAQEYRASKLAVNASRPSQPSSVQEMPSQEQPTPERLNDRQRAQFEKIRRSQGKEAAQEYRASKLAVNASRPSQPSAPSQPTQFEPVPQEPIQQPTAAVMPPETLTNPDFYYPELGATPEEIAGGLDFLGLGKIQDLVNQLNPDIFAMGPDNYTPSAYYQQLQKEASQQLDNAYAKRGLYGSGAAIQGQSDLTQRLLAEDVERAKALHTEKQGNLLNSLNNLMSTYSGTLSNLYGLKSGYDLNRPRTALELADFEHRVGQDNYNNRFRLFQELMGQNPLSTAASMSGQGAGIDQGYAGGIADTVGGIYNRPTTTTNFGGGVGPYVPPAPTGPDYTRRDQLALQGQVNDIVGRANAGMVGSGQGGVPGSGNTLGQIGQAAGAIKPIWDVISSFF